MFRPSLGHLQALKKTGPRLHRFFCKNALWDPTMRFYKNLCNLGSVFFEGLKMTQ